MLLVTKEKALAVATKTFELFRQSSLFSAEISELYSFKFKDIEHSAAIRYGEEIGVWLFENPHTYFATPSFEHRAINGLSDLMIHRMNTDIVTSRKRKRDIPVRKRNINEVDGYDLHLPIKPAAIEIEAHPKDLPLPYFFCSVAVVMSKSHMRLFFVYSNYEEREWGKHYLNEDYQLQTRETLITDEAAIVTLVSTITTNFEKYIQLSLETLLGGR